MEQCSFEFFQIKTPEATNVARRSCDPCDGYFADPHYYSLHGVLGVQGHDTATAAGDLYAASSGSRSGSSPSDFHTAAGIPAER